MYFCIRGLCFQLSIQQRKYPGPRTVLLVLFQEKGVQFVALAEDNNSNYWCAAMEPIICKTAAATKRHICPVCQGCVHAICGEKVASHHIVSYIML